MAEINLEGLSPVFRSDGKTLILPVDHDYDLVSGKSSVADLSEHLLVANVCKVDAILGHEDAIAENRAILEGIGKIQQINAAVPHSASRILIRTVEQAYANGADMFGVHFNIGSEEELQTFRDIEAQASVCDSLGMPWKMFAHVYLRKYINGKPYNFDDVSADEYGKLIIPAVQRVISLGARIVKVAFREEETFRQTVSSAHEAGIPIVMAGGKMVSTHEFLDAAIKAINGGADGIAAGRNVWGYSMNEDRPPLDIAQFGIVPSDHEPSPFTDYAYLCPDNEITTLIALNSVVHGNSKSVGDALGVAFRAFSLPKVV